MISQTGLDHLPLSGWLEWRPSCQSARATGTWYTSHHSVEPRQHQSLQSTSRGWSHCRSLSRSRTVCQRYSWWSSSFPVYTTPLPDTVTPRASCQDASLKSTDSVAGLVTNQAPVTNISVLHMDDMITSLWGTVITAMLLNRPQQTYRWPSSGIDCITFLFYADM